MMLWVLAGFVGVIIVAVLGSGPIVNWIFHLRLRRLANKRVSCAHKSRTITLMEPARCAIARRGQDYIDITDIYKCLQEQDMLSVPRLRVYFPDITMIYIYLAAPYEHISGVMDCQTLDAQIHIGHEAVGKSVW